MNTKKLIAAATVLFATGAACAQTTEYVEFKGFVSTKTRAEVRAELEQAYASGELARKTEFVEFVNVPSTRARADVRNEAQQAARTSRNAIDG